MKELDEIDAYINRELVSLLMEMVPEYQVAFKEGFSKEIVNEKGIYLLLNEFAVSLSKELTVDLSSKFVKNAFNFINAVGESNNLELLNIVKIGILEILYTSKGLDRGMVLSLLSDKLKIQFNSFSSYYY